MEKETKNKILGIILALIIIGGFMWYKHYEKTTIAGRINVIKELKMSDIADVSK